jgi:RNA polymerase sigma-70 factor (ECF subfamily)
LIGNEIIEQCRNGDLHDFRKLVETATPFAFSVAFRLMGDKEQAEDIVQETMITIWKTIGKIRSAESFKTWMYKIVVNKCHDEMRRKKSRPEFIADDTVWRKISERISVNPGNEMDNAEMAEMISALTENLSPKQKTVFVLADLEQLTNAEISSVTRMSLTTIKANLYYARKKIGELIEKHM